MLKEVEHMNSRIVDVDKEPTLTVYPRKELFFLIRATEEEGGLHFNVTSNVYEDKIVSFLEQALPKHVMDELDFKKIKFN
jgi:hypothetical protein